MQCNKAQKRQNITIMKNSILFFVEFSAQRRELRKIWNSIEPVRKTWIDFLNESDLKVLKVSDALNISLKEIEKTYHINELLDIYNSLYKIN